MIKEGRDNVGENLRQLAQSIMADTESPMWTLFVKKGDGSTASLIERRDVFMVSRAPA